MFTCVCVCVWNKVFYRIMIDKTLLKILGGGVVGSGGKKKNVLLFLIYTTTAACVQLVYIHTRIPACPATVRYKLQRNIAFVWVRVCCVAQHSGSGVYYTYKGMYIYNVGTYTTSEIHPLIIITTTIIINILPFFPSLPGSYIIILLYMNTENRYRFSQNNLYDVFIYFNHTDSFTVTN